MLRTGHKGLAAGTLLCDMLKGTVAVVLARWFGGMEAGAGGRDRRPSLGHLFPVWLGFKGGKGVATYLGVLLGLAWPAALVFGVMWIAVAALTRYSSLAALIASAAAPAFLWLIGGNRLAGLFLVLTLVLWVMHRANIARLVSGTEGQIGQRSSAGT